MKSSDLKKKIFAGERVSKAEALELFSWDLLDLGHAADARRNRIVPGGTVGFILDRIINFTNICEASCTFCAYHARAGQVEPFELTIDDILEKIGALVAIGGTQVMLQGGLHPDYTLETYTRMLSGIRSQYPDIYLHSFSPAEIAHMARKNRLNISTVIKELKAAGLNSVPGASDLLIDRIRSVACPSKLSANTWRKVIYTLAENNMKSSATMTYGMGETSEERIDHLDIIRTVQDDTSIIRAFIPWSFSPSKTGMEQILPATGMDYLKIVALSRIYLDNVSFIQAGWLTEGLKLAQVALAMGANDMGGVLMEESVVKATGIETSTNQEELIDIIQNAGKIPVQRDSDYTIIRSFS